MRKVLEYAGIAASVVLIAFGVGSIVTGFNGRERVSDDLAREHIGDSGLGDPRPTR